MNEEKKNDNVQLPRKTYVHIVGVILLTAILASMFIWGVILYVAGRFNSVVAYGISLLIQSCLLIPLIVVCLLVLVVRLVSRWRRLSHGQRRLHVLIVVACAAFTVLEVTTGMVPSPLMMYVRGFTGYAVNATDVQAIQNWLGTLDPNECRGQYVYLESATGVNPNLSHIDASRSVLWPPSLARFHPVQIGLLLDDTGRPMIRLQWGSSFVGSWGIVVGIRDMRTPETQESAWSKYQKPGGEMQRVWEYRRPIAPGAYVWAHMEQ